MSRHDGTDLMRRLVLSLPDQLAAAVEVGALEPLFTAAPRRIVMCGMGGSAIAGDLVQPLLGTSSLLVRRDYGLPAWVGPDDLVIGSSYSGNTEETLAGWDEAGRRRCPRVAITSGGELAERAHGAGDPVLTLPGGLPPRASLGHGLGTLVRALDAVGALAFDGENEIAAAVAVLRDRGDILMGEAAAEDGTSHPRAVATDLLSAMAVIHAAGDAAHGAGRRLAAQLNENAKVPALATSYPELDHNEIVGWGEAAELPGRFALITLRGGDEDPRTARRIGITTALLTGTFTSVHEVTARGEGVLARAMSLVQWGDALSWHLADLRGIDPVPVARIESLKTALGSAPANPKDPAAPPRDRSDNP